MGPHHLALAPLELSYSQELLHSQAPSAPAA
jgi:hypothetical protein